MALSGVTTFTLTRDDVIKASLRLLRELGAGAVPTIEDYENCNQALNIVLKSWQKKSIPLWKLKEITFPLLKGEIAYPLGAQAATITTGSLEILLPGTDGVDGTYYVDVLDGNNPSLAITAMITILGGAVTTMYVAPQNPSPGFTDPYFDVFPEQPSDWDYNITPMGILGDRPIRFRDAWIRIIETSQDTPLIQVARHDYNQFSIKTQQGVANQYWYDPQLDTGILTVYNAPSDYTRELHGIVQIPINDMVSTTDDFDLPQEWLQAIKWGLADELSLEYGCPPDVRGEVAAKAAKFLEDCFDFSVDEGPVYFTVDRSGR
jgi:hypothetical protein